MREVAYEYTPSYQQRSAVRLHVQFLRVAAAVLVHVYNTGICESEYRTNTSTMTISMSQSIATCFGYATAVTAAAAVTSGATQNRCCEKKRYISHGFRRGSAEATGLPIASAFTGEVHPLFLHTAAVRVANHTSILPHTGSVRALQCCSAVA
jgi:hypothetical protein